VSTGHRGILYLLRYGAVVPNYRMFRGEPSELRTVSGVIQLGLFVLIATPVARVAFSVLLFARQRDYLYVLITLVVFGLLCHSLLGGGDAHGL
jgi:uncharacterized membrane protein